jgi:hypothetical protein
MKTTSELLNKTFEGATTTQHKRVQLIFDDGHYMYKYVIYRYHEDGNEFNMRSAGYIGWVNLYKYDLGSDYQPILERLKLYKCEDKFNKRIKALEKQAMKNCNVEIFI